MAPFALINNNSNFNFCSFKCDVSRNVLIMRAAYGILFLFKCYIQANKDKPNCSLLHHFNDVSSTYEQISEFGPKKMELKEKKETI